MKWVVVLLSLVLSFRAMALDPAALRRAADYSAAREGFTFLVMEQGKIVFEDYRNGASAKTPCDIFSGTKGFWVLATLVAAKEGLLSLDEPASRTLVEWRSEPHRAKITIRQLLNCTSGLEPNSRLQRHNVPDVNAAAMITQVVAPAGQAFTYGPSHYQVLCEILRRKLAPFHTTPFEYLQAKILDPLGLPAFDHYEDPAGNPLFATSFSVTARQWAKVGQLILLRGRFGIRQVVESDLLAQCFRGSRACSAFGLGFWNNREAKSGAAREIDIEDALEPNWARENWAHVCMCKDAPADLVVSLGSGYQRLYVIPSLDLVIVRQGRNAHFSDGAFLRMILAK
jgi:CubicO group peptidase (beta-lactamase class C family)